MNENFILHYQSEIEEFFDESQHAELHNIFASLDFKLKKNGYHLANIQRIIQNASTFDKEDYYAETHLAIYFEVESLLVSLRSTVDILLHLANFTFHLGIPTNEVNLYTVFHHKKLPRNVKHIFERYTKPYNNPTWSFIYTSRNEIVHEKSVNLVLPIDVQPFGYDKPMVFFDWEENQREMTSFFGQCLRFLENFSSQYLRAVKLSLKSSQ